MRRYSVEEKAATVFPIREYRVIPATTVDATVGEPVSAPAGTWN